MLNRCEVVAPCSSLCGKTWQRLNCDASVAGPPERHHQKRQTCPRPRSAMGSVANSQTMPLHYTEPRLVSGPRQASRFAVDLPANVYGQGHRKRA